MSTFDCDVAVVGAGPSGLAAAVSAAMRGLSVVVVHEPVDRNSGARAPVVHAGTMRVLNEMGCAESILAEASKGNGMRLRTRRRVLVTNSMTDLPGPFNFATHIAQPRVEAILRARAESLGVRFVARPAVGVTQDESGATVELEGGAIVTTKYVVAADGWHSTIRQALSIAYPEATKSRGDREDMLIADIRPSGVADADHVNIVLGDGILVVIPLPGGTYRVVMNAPSQPGVTDEDLLRRELIARRPFVAKGEQPFEIVEILDLNRFHIRHHLAETFRVGRVLLAGDAGHTHSPAGGQGMNLGIRDGYYLGDGLSLAVGAESVIQRDAILDVYATNRRMVALKVIELTSRMTNMMFAPPPARPIRNLVLRIASRTPASKKQALGFSGLMDRGPEYLAQDGTRTRVSA